MKAMPSKSNESYKVSNALFIDIYILMCVKLIQAVLANDNYVLSDALY